MASAASVSPARPPLGLALAAVALAAAASATLLYWALPDPRVAAAFFAGVLALGVPLAFTARGARSIEAEPDAPVPDRSLIRAALGASSGAAAITDAAGALVAANSAYEQWFGASAPAELPGAAAALHDAA